MNREPSWWEKITGQVSDEYPAAWQVLATKAQDWLADEIPVWRLGAAWHYRFHIPADDHRKVKQAWCDTKKVGDVVCDCRGLHLKITKFFSNDDVELEDGGRCSLYHCCSDPDDGPEPVCHHGVPLDEYLEE